jgi:hypothetical protein
MPSHEQTAVLLMVGTALAIFAVWTILILI